MNIANINIPNITGLTPLNWLCLSFLSGVGPARLSRLYTYLSQLNLESSPELRANNLAFDLSIANDLEHNNGFDISNANALSLDTLKALKWPDVTARQAMAYLSSESLTQEQEEKRDISLDWLSNEHHFLIFRHGNHYPDELEEISVAPAFLYFEGDLNCLSYPKLGVVGSRKCSPYGRDITLHIAAELSSQGVCIVSGGAVGIDTAAHQGALSSTVSPTIAVMGTGLLHRYPNHNASVFERVLEQGGALISEYPLMTTPRPHLFPPRNRIISGLSKGILVTEASIKSGSLISANYAVQQNREVFAVPGRVTDKQSSGCHELLKQGAVLVRGVKDILNEFPNLGVFASEQEQSDVKKLEGEAVESVNSVWPDISRKSTEQISEQEIELAQTKEKRRRVSRLEPSLLKSQPEEINFHTLPEAASNIAQQVIDVFEEAGESLDFDHLIVLSGLEAGQLMQVLVELELYACIENRMGLYCRV